MLFLFPLLACSLDIRSACTIVDGKPNIIDFTEDVPSEYDAYAIWEDVLNETGWYRFHVHGNPESVSKNVMRCAGALEGFLSHERMYQHFKLLRDIQGWELPQTYPKEIEDFLTDNLKYVRQAVEAYPESEYWRQISLIIDQFDGLVEGYAMADSKPMTELDHWFLQSIGDMNEITERFPDAAPRKASFFGEHCSGMIRLLPDFSDVYMAHDAWSDYRELHGELKEYNLNIREFAAKTLTLSTRIGKLSSYDDFYINDRGLFVIETTIGTFNDEMLETIVPQSVFTWLRATHACWTASSGKEWVDTFVQHNSGTYNNQYLILDSKKFTPFEQPKSDLLWAVEQLPQTYEAADITDVLVRDMYFPSFNTPYFKRIFEEGHFPQKIASWGKDGSYWDYYTSSRYLIMKREAPRIRDFDTFKSFMRYANWRKDPYSNGDSGQMIMSRYELREGLSPLYRIGTFGGLDTKALRLVEAATKLHFHALASPEYVYNPVFKFSNLKQKIEHDGLPDEWKFNWTTFSSQAFDKCADHKEKDCKELMFCGYCVSNKKCMPGDKEGPFFGDQCSAGWRIKVVEKSWAVPVVATTTVCLVLFVCVIYVVAWMHSKDKLSL